MHPSTHDDVIKWKHFLCYWPFVWGIHCSLVFPAQRPVMWSFDVFFHLRLNKRFNNQAWGWWFEMSSCSLWCHCNVMHIPSRVFAHEIHMNIILMIPDYFSFNTLSDKITTQTTMNYNFNLMSTINWLQCNALMVTNTFIQYQTVISYLS